MRVAARAAYVWHKSAKQHSHDTTAFRYFVVAMRQCKQCPFHTCLTPDKFLQGHFEVTDDISEFTKANFMNGIGKKTPVAVRFSTVTMERDSPESLRDVRGFSVKWYTEEGNWDLVGNNVPVSPLELPCSFDLAVVASRVKNAW